MPSLEDLTHEQLLALAREQQQSTNLLAALGGNPETREILQKAVKKIAPNAVIPELDAKNAMSKELEDVRKENAEIRKSILERDLKDRIKQDRETIKKKYELTDEQVTAVEKLMLEPENAGMSHDAAARVYKASITPSTPTSSSFKPPATGYDMPEKDVWAGGIGNPAKLNKIALDEAGKAFADIMSGKKVAA